jgi:peptidyl-prolyl cis-trans isomerase SurA
MMTVRSVILFSAAVIFLLSSCVTKHSEVIVAKFHDQEITLEEFEQAYAKNVGGYERAKDDSVSRMKNFLDLYLNFKMKLRDAKVRDYDSHPDLIAELEDYKNKVGVTYLLEKRLIEPGIRELYERRKKEYRVSHLMLRPDPGTEDESEALANSLLDSIKNGADFEELVERHSQDQFSKQAGGDIFYITAGLLPLEFEDAVYKTAEGEVYPEVVRTRFGFHLIKVTEIRERVPAVKASHILVTYANEEGVPDTLSAKAKADSLHKRILEGEDFANLAMEYSEDPGSKDSGGDLGFFERRMMVKEFDETAFNLDIGEVSDIVQTNFGFHIIKLTDKRAYPSFEEERENLKKTYQNTRHQTVYNNFIEELKVRYNYKVDSGTFDFVLSEGDSVRLDASHPRYNEFGGMTIFTYAEKSVSAEEFLEKVVDKKDYYNKVITKDLLTRAVEAVASDYLLEEEASHLEETDQDFAALMDDYKNGIFIFRLQEEEVWNNINIDSTKLYAFYEETRENYRFPDRSSFAEIFTKSDSLINYYYSLLQNGTDFDTLVINYTERPGFKEKEGIYPLQSLVTSKLYEEAFKLEKPGDYSEPIQNSGGYSIIKLIQKDPSRVKTFEEARAEVAGAFQENESKRLEQAYLENLKNRYKPTLYYSELEKAFKSGE